MAAFRTHVVTGVAVGYIAGVVAGTNQWFLWQFTPLLMFSASFVGSFLPDVDSDHSKPFGIVFDLLAFIGAFIAFSLYLRQPDVQIVHWLLLPPLTAIMIRYGVAEIIRRFTRHRGMFHSIPAMLIAVLATMLALKFLHLPAQDTGLLAVSVGLGFLSHLILDEIYSTVNFEGLKFVPKKSLGSALALTSSSKAVTITVYALLVVLFYLNLPVLIQVFSMIK